MDAAIATNSRSTRILMAFQGKGPQCTETVATVATYRLIGTAPSLYTLEVRFTQICFVSAFFLLLFFFSSGVRLTVVDGTVTCVPLFLVTAVVTLFVNTQ